MDYSKLKFLVLNNNNKVNLTGLTDPVKNFFKPMIDSMNSMDVISDDVMRSYLDDIMDIIKLCHGIVCDPITLNDTDLFNLGIILYLADLNGMTDGIPVLYRGPNTESMEYLSLRDQRFIVHYCIEKVKDVWESTHLVASNICNYKLLDDKELTKFSRDKGWTPVMCIGKNTDWISIAAIYYIYGYKTIHQVYYNTNSTLLRKFFTYIPKLVVRG